MQLFAVRTTASPFRAEQVRRRFQRVQFLLCSRQQLLLLDELASESLVRVALSLKDLFTFFRSRPQIGDVGLRIAPRNFRFSQLDRELVPSRRQGQVRSLQL